MPFVVLQLELLVRDSKSQVKHAENEASKLVKFGCVGYTGAWASGPSIALAKLLSVESINRAIMGYSAASPQLSKDDFSNYVRTSPSTAAKLLVKLMKGLSLVYAMLCCFMK